jgi:hypothetical protein
MIARHTQDSTVLYEYITRSGLMCFGFLGFGTITYSNRGIFLHPCSKYKIARDDKRGDSRVSALITYSICAVRHACHSINLRRVQGWNFRFR